MINNSDKLVISKESESAKERKREYNRNRWSQMDPAKKKDSG